MNTLSRWAAVVALALPFAAFGTVVIGQTFEQMARDTPLIVVAKAQESEARWDDDRRGISTWTNLQIIEVLKGKAPASLVVRQPGGEVGNIGAHVSGAARFAPGEEVLLFLEPPGDDAQKLIVRGLSAGKVRLGKDALGRRVATRDLRGVSFWTPDGSAPGGGGIRELGGVEELGDADAFVKRIREAVKAAQDKRGGR